jgi:signal transduction histidine kinase
MTVSSAFAALRRALPRGDALPEPEWRHRHRVVTGVLAVAVPVTVVFGAARGYHARHIAVDVAPMLVGLLAACLRDIGPRARTAGSAFGLMSTAAALVHLSDGSTVAHFAFFVVLPLLTLYQSWVPFGLAVAYVLVHHGVFGVIEPEHVFDAGGADDRPWLWAGVHTGFVVLATAASVYAWRVNEDAAAANARLQLRADADEDRRRRALEINDDIVQGLVVAKLALDLEDPERCRDALESTLRAARGIIGDLLETVEFDERALTRRTATTVGVADPEERHHA